MSWTRQQAKSFAKRIAESKQGRACWWAWPTEVREAIVSEFVLLIVLGQDKGAVEIEAIRALREMVCEELEQRYRMPVERQL